GGGIRAAGGVTCKRRFTDGGVVVAPGVVIKGAGPNGRVAPAARVAVKRRGTNSDVEAAIRVLKKGIGTDAHVGRAGIAAVGDERMKRESSPSSIVIRITSILPIRSLGKSKGAERKRADKEIAQRGGQSFYG